MRGVIRELDGELREVKNTAERELVDTNMYLMGDLRKIRAEMENDRSESRIAIQQLRRACELLAGFSVAGSAASASSSSAAAASSPSAAAAPASASPRAPSEAAASGLSLGHNVRVAAASFYPSAAAASAKARPSAAAASAKARPRPWWR
jgi:hypothetical protein